MALLFTNYYCMLNAYVGDQVLKMSHDQSNPGLFLEYFFLNLIKSGADKRLFITLPPLSSATTRWLRINPLTMESLYLWNCANLYISLLLSASLTSEQDQRWRWILQLLLLYWCAAAAHFRFNLLSWNTMWLKWVYRACCTCPFIKQTPGPH